MLFTIHLGQGTVAEIEVVERPDLTRRRWRASEAAPYGLLPVMAMVLLTMVDAAESRVMSGVLPTLQDEWGFGDFAAGAIPTAALLAGLGLILPAGYLADRARRTRLLAVVVALWSVVTLGSALAVSFGMFFATRTLLGAAQSIDNPSVSSLLTDWYAPAARARAFGYQRVSLAVGGGLGAAIGGIVGEAAGWRWAFAVFVAPGLLVAWFVARQPEPPRGALDADGEAREVEPSPVPTISTDVDAVDRRSRTREVLDDARDVLRIPTARLLFVGLSIYAAVLGAVIFWLPSFFGRIHDLGEGRAASIGAAVLGIGSLTGAIIGGELGDRRHAEDRPFRMTLALVGMAGGLGLFGLGVTLDRLAPQVLLMLVGMGFAGLIASTFPAIIADVVPAARRGIAYSLFQLIVNLGLAVGPLAVGGISEATDSLRMAFLVCLPLAAVGASIMARGRSHYVMDMGRRRTGERA